MLTLPLLLATLALPADAPSDELLYLFSKYDADVFGDLTTNDAGDFDGFGVPFPVGSLPEERRIRVESQRFGAVEFLRPKSGADETNALTPSGQTIDVRTKNRFNWLLSLGAAYPAPDDQQGASGDVEDWLELGFTDGSTARAPIAFSNWTSETPSFGEELGLQGTADPNALRTAIGRDRTIDARVRSNVMRQLASATGFRLWLQRTPIPADRTLASIRFPASMHARIVGLTLVWREGVELPVSPAGPVRERARVAIFSEPGFPSTTNPYLTAAVIENALAQHGIDSAPLRLDHLVADGVLVPERFPVLVLPYGDSYPVDALDALRRYRLAGGAVVHTGAPFSRPISRSFYGGYRQLAPAADVHTYDRATGLGFPALASVSATTLRASPALVDWGLGDLPWARYSLGSETGLASGYVGIDTRNTPDGTKITPLLELSLWTTPAAGVVSRVSGDFVGALDVWTPYKAMWLDGARVQTKAQAEFIARAAAYCLHEKGRIDDDLWTKATKPFPLEFLVEPVGELDVADAVPLLPERPDVTKAKVLWLTIDPVAAEENVLLASAQGLLHREVAPGVDARLAYLAVNDSEEAVLQRLVTEGYVGSVERVTARDLLDRAAKRRAVLVDPDVPATLDVATMVAAIEGVLVAYPAQVPRYELEVAADLRGVFDSNDAIHRFAIDTLLPALGASVGGRPGFMAIGPSSPHTWALRDLAVAERAFVISVPTSETVRGSIASAIASADEALGRARLLAPVLGMGETIRTRTLTRSVSSGSHGALAARHGSPSFPRSDPNGSFWSLLAAKKRAKARSPAPVELDETKVYLAVAEVPANPSLLLSTLQRDVAMANAPAEVRVRLRTTISGRGGPPNFPRSPVTSLDLLRFQPALEELAGSEPARGLQLDVGSLGRQGRAYGEGRSAYYDTLFTAASGAIGAAHLDYVVVDAAGGEEDAWLESAARLGSERALFALGTGETSVVGATTFAGEIPVFRCLPGARLQELLGGALKRYRRLQPLFLSVSQSDWQIAQGETTRATVSGRIVTQVQAEAAAEAAAAAAAKLPENVVLVTPEELARLAREFSRRRRLARVEVFGKGAEWRYHDGGEDLGLRWRAAEYDDSAWKSGPAEFGYGDAEEGRPEATALSFGDDAAKKHPTYYFRRRFSVDPSTRPRYLEARVSADDGCVIWLNGQEVARVNMPDGEIAYGTMASSAIGGASELVDRVAEIELDALKDGENVIAVEVHQGSASSSDMGFDMALEAWRWEDATAK